jgi:tetratricopeptide (TPR) repeat protein
MTRRALALLVFPSSLCLMCPLWLCAESKAAALDPEINQPYHLKVVLQIAKHPLLTEVFKNQVSRELRDGLQAAFGNMGLVQVVDRHPLLPEIERHGLGQPLDREKSVSDTKTHFVLIDFVNGQYEIQARQHDGLTGLVSPVIRRDRTTDRQFVSRAATLLIDQDLGVVGTLEEQPKGDMVRIVLKGSGLGQPMDRWVKKDDVFAIVRISRVGNEWRSKREEWALLQVKDGPASDGTCGCRYYHRFLYELRSGSMYRCIKLGTTTASLRLRLLNKKDRRPLSNKVVSFSHIGFDSGSKRESGTDTDGYVTPPEPFTNIAFVRVAGADKDLARIPIEIIDDRTITCEIEPNPDAEEWTRCQQHRREYDQHLNESISAAGNLFRDLTRVLGQKEYVKALEMARKGLVDLQAQIQSRTEELSSLRKEISDLNRSDPTLTDAGIRVLEKQAKELEDRVKNYEEVVNQRNEPRRQQLLAKVEQANQNELTYDYDEAIAAYEEAVKLAEATNETIVLEKTKKRLRELQNAWRTKSEEHLRARNFIKNDWPKLGTAELKERIPDARKMFEVCKKNNDKLTPRRLLKGNLNHAGRLLKLQEELDSKRDDDQQKLRALSELVDELNKLTKEVYAYVDPAKASAKADEEDPDKE